MKHKMKKKPKRKFYLLSYHISYIALTFIGTMAKVSVVASKTHILALKELDV